MEFLIKALATWRLSHMLVHEDGPFAVFEKLRKITRTQIDEPVRMDNKHGLSPLWCVWCTSVWVGAVVDWRKTFALSAVAIFIEELMAWQEQVRERFFP